MANLEELERAARETPEDHADALAEAYLAEGRAQDAIGLLEDLTPRSTERTVLLAQGYFDDFDNAAAAELLKSLSTEPKDSLRAQLLLGELAYEGGRSSKAKVHLHRVRAMAPNHRRATELLIALGEELSDPEDRSQPMGFSTEDPERESLGSALLQIVIGLVVFGTAFALYAWQVTRADAAERQLSTAADHLSAGDLSAAIGTFAQVLDADPDDPRAIAGMAEAQALQWVEAGDLNAEVYAIEWLGKAQSLEIDRPERWAAELLVGVGRNNAALLQRTTAELSGRSVNGSRLHHALGRARRVLGDAPTGLDSLRRAHRESEQNPIYACALARALIEDGQDAATVLAKAGSCKL